MVLVNPGEHLIPTGKASFADVKETVAKKFPDDIVVGMIPHGREMVLAPALDFEHDYKDDDQIILLSRRFSMKADDNFDPVEEAKKRERQKLTAAAEAGKAAEEADRLKAMGESVAQAKEAFSAAPPAAPLELPGSIMEDAEAAPLLKEEEPTHEAAWREVPFVDSDLAATTAKLDAATARIASMEAELASLRAKNERLEALQRFADLE